METLHELRKQLEEERQLRLNAENLCKHQQELLHKLKVDLTEESNEELKEDLKLKNDNYIAIFKNLPLGLIVEDANRNITLTNHFFCELFKRKESPEDLCGLNTLSVFNESKHIFIHGDQFISSANTIVQNHKVVIDDILHLIDGRIYSRNYIPILNDINACGIWTFEDVSEKYEANTHLKLLYQIADECPNPILRCTKDGKIVYANQAADTLRNVSNPNFTHIEIGTLVENCLKFKKPIKVDMMVQKQFYELFLVPIHSQEYVNVYATDISEEARFQNNNTLLKNLINETEDAILCIRENGQILFANFEAAKRFDMSVDELLTKSIIEIDVDTNTIEKWNTKFQDIKNQGVATVEGYKKYANTDMYVEIVLKYTQVLNEGYVIAISRNITERKDSYNKLNVQKHFYESILNNIPAEIVVYDTHHRYMFVNPYYIKEEESRKWAIGKTDYDLSIVNKINFETANTRINYQDLALQKKELLEWEDYASNGNDSFIYFLRRFQPIDLQDQTTMIIGYGIDITSHKLLENRLKASEERNRMVIDASNDCIWDWNIHTGHMFFSDRWKELLGYKTEDIFESSIKTWYMHIHPEDMKVALRAFYSHLYTNDPYNCTLRFVTKNLEVKWMMCRGNAIRNAVGKPERMVGTCTDITNLKEAEEQLKSSEERLSTLFNHAYDANLLIDTIDFKITDCNQRAIDLYSFTNKDALIGKPVSKLFKENAFNEIIPLIRSNISKQGFTEHELLGVQNNNIEFWSNLAIRRIVVDNKELFLFRISDISRHKKLETDLIKAKVLMEDSIKTKELFLANVSHEIRTPMNGIVGLLDLFKKTNLDETQLKYLELIKKNSDNLLFILNDILDFSKLESGKFKLESTKFDLIEVINNAYNLFKAKAEEKGIELILDAPKLDSLWLVGDPFRLSQVLLNLVSNAIKFTEKGKVTIQALITELDSNRTKVKFNIIDTGIGISNDKIRIIFEGFEQAHSNISRKFGGTGLGLAISKKLIEIQGGEIHVSSELNYGSTFTFELIYSKTGSEPKAPKIENKNWAVFSNIKILLAEDNEVNQFLVKEMLSNKGMHIEVVSNGEEAIEKINQMSYDLMLLDIQMPKVSGEEVIAFVRKHKDNRVAQTPIIVLTANGLVGDNKKYLELGASDYLPKPFNSEHLFEKISNLMNSTNTCENVFNSMDSKDSIIKEEEGLFDFSFFDQSMINSPDFIKTICEIFIQTTPPQLEALINAYEEKDWKRLASVAHKLKTTITSFHIMRVKEAILEVEQNALQEKNIHETRALIEQVVSTVKEVVEKVKKQLMENV